MRSFILPAMVVVFAVLAAVGIYLDAAGPRCPTVAPAHGAGR